FFQNRPSGAIKLFYYSTGACFVLFFYSPWTICYTEKIGYCQAISDILLIAIFIQIFAVFLLVYQTFKRIKSRINDEISHLKKSIVFGSGKNLSLLEQIPVLENKLNIFRMIVFSLFFGGFITFLGLTEMFMYSSIDTIGFVIAFLPQAYYLSINSDFYLYLLVNKARINTIELEKTLSAIQKSDQVFFASEIQPLLEFIEKSDFLLRYKNEKDN
ncbi:MAG: hypothetical protein ACTSW1_04710, partial [Candidatus Hodarchaeales archaeon]